MIDSKPVGRRPRVADTRPTSGKLTLRRDKWRIGDQLASHVKDANLSPGVRHNLHRSPIRQCHDFRPRRNYTDARSRIHETKQPWRCQWRTSFRCARLTCPYVAQTRWARKRPRHGFSENSHAPKVPNSLETHNAHGNVTGYGGAGWVGGWADGRMGVPKWL